jgi:hypothetical protein
VAALRGSSQTDKVIGVAGNASFDDCAVNRTWKRSTGYYVINVGYRAECFVS